MPIKLHRDHFRWSNGRGHNQKPILVAHKKDNLGLGKQLHSTDQWWLNAFDSQLKSLDVSTSSTTGKITVEQTQSNNPLSMSIKSRYYIRFVRGGLLKGEIEEKVSKEEEKEREETATPGGTDDELRAKRSKEEKRKEKGERRRRRKEEGKGKKEKSKEKGNKEKSGEKKEKKRKARDGREETKEERRERKRLKRLVAKEMAALSV